jgi:hypothetical protein
MQRALSLRGAEAKKQSSHSLFEFFIIHPFNPFYPLTKLLTANKKKSSPAKGGEGVFVFQWICLDLQLLCKTMGQGLNPCPNTESYIVG